MHIQRSEDIVFANNQIVGSRMGAFFLAEYCKNALVTGNIVDGTNGSRVISLEKSSENVVLMGNTFRNGGRGSWINQPRNLILQGNIFVNNTTKCIPDPWQGRKTFKTGTWESYPEMYFTLHQPKGEYGPVILKDNLFVLGEHGDAEGVTFAPNGHDIQMTGNVFQKRSTQIVLDPGCQKMNVRDNPGADVLVRKPTSQSGNW
jgi:parallel beta-helix repeat protein